MMKLSRSRCVFTIFLIEAGFLYLAEVTEGVNEFRRCYNTSIEMHCFAVQYDANNRTLVTSNDNARQRCNNLSSTLIVIDDEATNNIVKHYISDPSNPIRYQHVWTDAYRKLFTDYDNYDMPMQYTWYWVNSRLPPLDPSEVSYTDGYKYYVSTLEFRSKNGKPPQFYLTANLPHDLCSYICEYAVFRCSTTDSMSRNITGRCYVAVSTQVSWYEARNRCLRNGGDLASFANVTSINFTSWLGSYPNSRFWIGLRFTWYIWKESGREVRFVQCLQNNDFSVHCLATCTSCGKSLSLVPTDCNSVDGIHVVCHSSGPIIVTSLDERELSMEIAETTSTVGKTTHTGIQPKSNYSSKRTASLPIPFAVEVGVPIIAAIIVIVSCVVKRHRYKNGFIYYAIGGPKRILR